MIKKCVLYERDCIECGECDRCDLDPKATPHNCGFRIMIARMAAYFSATCSLGAMWEHEIRLPRMVCQPESDLPM